jgi:hypothetical protein
VHVESITEAGAEMVSWMRVTAAVLCVCVVCNICVMSYVIMTVLELGFRQYSMT